MKLSKFSRFKIFTNKFDECVMFHQIFSRSVKMSSSFAKTFSYVSLLIHRQSV